jgi:hypothetical protein
MKNEITFDLNKPNKETEKLVEILSKSKSIIMATFYDKDHLITTIWQKSGFKVICMKPMIDN